MISFFHVPVLVICLFFLLLPLWRFWVCIHRMGFTREVSRRAPLMPHTDLAAGILAFLPFVVALADWTAVTLPGKEGPLSPYAALFVSVACLALSVFILNKTGERIAPHWAGARESALRTVAALRIISAAELAHALEVAQQHEARHGSGRVIDAEVQEVRK